MTLAARAPARALLAPGGRHGTLPWMIAATSFLAVLGFAAALMLAGAARTLADTGAGRYTIEIVDADPVHRAALAAQLLARTRALPDVAAATPVAPEAIARLVAPVLGTHVGDAIPLPALIDVTLIPGASADRLARSVRTAPQATLIAATEGLAPLAALVAALRGLALAIATLAVVVTLLLAVLAARATLAAHAATLAIVHALGASDADIATLIQRRAARDALAGGAIGFGAAAAVVWLIGRRYAALGPLAPGDLSLGAGGWLALAGVPLALVALAMLTARHAVLVVLGRQP